MHSKVTESRLGREKPDYVSRKEMKRTFAQMKAVAASTQTEPIGFDVFLQNAERILTDALESENDLRLIIAELSELITTNKFVFEQNYIDVMQNCILGDFCQIVVCCQIFAMSRKFIDSDAILLHKLIDAATIVLSKGIAKFPDILDLRQARGTLRQLVIFAAQLSKHNRMPIKNAEFCLLAAEDWGDAIDVEENIKSDRVLYLDNNLAITWFSSCLGNAKKFMPCGEITVAVKLPNGLWSFDKYANHRVSIVSLRKAQKYCLQWRGQKMVGQITHEESRRLASFLGFKIYGNKAYLGLGRNGFG